MKKVKNTKLSEETIKLIKTFIIVVVLFGGVYLIFLLLGAIGMFEKGYDKPEGSASEFTYNTALVGTVFNRSEKEYYVAFDTEDDANTYFNSLLSLYPGETQIYKVNMSLGINSKYLSSEGNYKATRPSELKIVCPTLIKIKNGKIIKYLDSIDKIEEELSK